MGLGSGLLSVKREITGVGCGVVYGGLRTGIPPGESLHGYRICIQAILQDKPKIATTNLGKVSSGSWWGHQEVRSGEAGWNLHCWTQLRGRGRACKMSDASEHVSTY